MNFFTIQFFLDVPVHDSVLHNKKCKNRLIMAIFRSAICILLLICCYEILTQYEETNEHQIK